MSFSSAMERWGQSMGKIWQWWLQQWLWQPLGCWQRWYGGTDTKVIITKGGSRVVVSTTPPFSQKRCGQGWVNLTQSSHNNLEQSCLFTFIIHFQFHSLFNIQNWTRQYFWLDYIDNACIYKFQDSSMISNMTYISCIYAYMHICIHLAHILSTPCTHLAHTLHTSCTHLTHILCTSCTYLTHILRTSCTYLAHILSTPCKHLAHILNTSCAS